MDAIQRLSPVDAPQLADLRPLHNTRDVTTLELRNKDLDCLDQATTMTWMDFTSTQAWPTTAPSARISTAQSRRPV
jgi:hypothetical protein